MDSNRTSILDTIKAMLGLPIDGTDFDIDVLAHINGSLAVMNQLGVGPKEGYVVIDKSQTFKDFLKEEPPTVYNLVKLAMFYRVKLGFDTESNQVSASLKELLSETEWRLKEHVDLARPFEREE